MAKSPPQPQRDRQQGSALGLVGLSETAVAILDLDAEKHLVFREANPAFSRMLATDGTPLDGRRLIEFQSRHAPTPGLRRPISAALADRGAVFDLPVRRADGKEIWIEADISRHQDEDGGALVLIARDVTETKLATKRVIDTLEAMTDGYYALDREWRFTYINSVGERVLESSREALIGKVIWEEFPATVGTNFEQYRNAMDLRVVTTFEEYFGPLEGWFEIRAYPIPDGIGVYFREITARHLADQERERLLAAEREARKEAERAQKALAYQATHDSLTDLLNRGELIERLEALLSNEIPVSVLFIDLDRFKLINDSLGHATGDRMLEELALRLAPLTAQGWIVARLGGDEFVIALPRAEPEQVDQVVETVLRTVRLPVRIDGLDLNTTASIGISHSTPGANASELLRDADVALYRAKDAGGDRASSFDTRARQELIQRVEIERELRQAIDAGELAMHYQTAFDLSTGEPVNCEALLRWSSPKLGQVAPAEFIPIAEESGLIEPIGRWVVETSIRECAGLARQGYSVWANVSIRQLSRPGLAAVIDRILRAHDLPPAGFGIEITESVLADHVIVGEELERIAKLGVGIAIDDFGTGYSSISRLNGLPVDQLKIDRAFIGALTTERGIETVTAIVELGHALGCIVVAEGVENEQQLAALQKTGCDQAAGYHLARPVPRHQLSAAIASVPLMQRA